MPKTWMVKIGASLLVLFLAFYSGVRVANWHRDSLELERMKVTEMVSLRVSEQIAKIEVKNVTIRQKAVETIREVPVYSECMHSPDGLRLIQQALTPPGGGGELSGPSPDGG